MGTQLPDADVPGNRRHATYDSGVAPVGGDQEEEISPPAMTADSAVGPGGWQAPLTTVKPVMQLAHKPSELHVVHRSGLTAAEQHVEAIQLNDEHWPAEKHGAPSAKDVAGSEQESDASSTEQNRGLLPRPWQQCCPVVLLHFMYPQLFPDAGQGSEGATHAGDLSANAPQHLSPASQKPSPHKTPGIGEHKDVNERDTSETHAPVVAIDPSTAMHEAQ